VNKIDLVESARLRKDIPAFRPGDLVKVHVKVSEGGRERLQVFEGVVIARRGGGLRETFTVRKISFNNIGVERTFPIHAPVVGKVEVVRHGRVRRAKLYYLRDLKGRHAKIDERRTRIPSAVVAPIVEPEEIVPELAPEEIAPEAPAADLESAPAAEASETPAAQEPAATE